jgi:hypothetical protein
VATLERAIQIAHEAHDGQLRRDGGPYVRHPLRVMARLAAAGYSEKAQMAAVLHDVVEDSEWTLEDLRREGFDEEVIDTVDRVTKREGDTDETVMARVIGHPLAEPLKEKDMDDNYEDNPTEKQKRKIDRRRAILAMARTATQAQVAI